MTKFVFRRFVKCEDGRMARLETEKTGIPINIFAENDTDYDLQNGEKCYVTVYGIGNLIHVYQSEEDYYNDGCTRAVPSMIPVGTFPPSDSEESFEESSECLFVGVVTHVDTAPDAVDNQPTYCLTVETLEMTIVLYLWSKGPIEVGYIIHGIAWLFGTITRA